MQWKWGIRKTKTGLIAKGYTRTYCEYPRYTASIVELTLKAASQYTNQVQCKTRYTPTLHLLGDWSTAEIALNKRLTTHSNNLTHPANSLNVPKEQPL